MLTLKRRNGERVQLVTQGGTEIWVTVTECGTGKCKLSFDAPDSVRILREELAAEWIASPTDSADFHSR